MVNELTEEQEAKLRELSKTPVMGINIDMEAIAQMARNLEQAAAQDMSAYGYVWNEATQQWECPPGYHVDENGYCVQD